MMDFQILDADYTYANSRPLIRLYGRNEQGESVCCFVPGFEPYFYLRASEDISGEVRDIYGEQIKNIEELERFEPIGYFEKPIKMLRITLFDPREVPRIREGIRKIPGVLELYETDILFRNRFLIDNNTGGMGWVRASPSEAEDINIKGISSEVKLVSTGVQPLEVVRNASLRYLAFDIECLLHNGGMPVPEHSPIVLISLAFKPSFGKNKSLVLVAKETPGVKGTESPVEMLPDEEAMINRFFEIVRDYDPDILLGYNTNGFDFPYIAERIKVLEKKGKRFRVGIGRDGRELRYRRVVNVVHVSVPGRVVVDVLFLLRREFSLKQYSLKATAKELLDMEKLDILPEEMEEYWRKPEKLGKFIEYARRDSELALEFLMRLRLLDKYIALARVSGSLLQDILDGGQSAMVENLLLREYRKNQRVVPPKPAAELMDIRELGEELKGGEVLEPKRGILEHVVILDYRSLYPTIMMAHNLCYTTVIIKDEPGEVIVAPSGGRFASPKILKGIVPGILENLLNQRAETRKKMKTASEEEYRVLDATQLALKILLNSFYGYSGYARARLYNLTLANAVTSFGRENILRTKAHIEAIGELYLNEKVLTKEEGRKGIGLSVVYGDTDSVFVQLDTPGISYDDAERVGGKIAEIVSEKLPKPMELAFESFARRVIFIAKKRYAMWAFEKSPEGWRGKIKVKGMETVRRDWCELTSKTVDAVLELVLEKGDADAAGQHVRDVINRIRNIDIRTDKALFEDLILTRQYTKKTESYKSKQPHASLVEKLKKRTGVTPNIGDRVPFVIIAGMGLFVDRAEDPRYAQKHNLPLDVDYYINKQILPPVERILRDFGVGAETMRIMGEIKPSRKEAAQRSLFEF